MTAGNREVTFTRVNFVGQPECLIIGCSKRLPPGDRAAAKRHVRDTGHVVRFTVQDVTVYEAREARDA